MKSEDNLSLFQEFLRDKTVAIIGRAEYLNHMEQGEYIDGFDIVLRSHSNLPYPYPPFDLEFEHRTSFIPERFHKQLGQRTDAFAPTNLPFWTREVIYDTLPSLMRRGCKFIVQHKIYNVPPEQNGIKAKFLPSLDLVNDKFLPVYVASQARFDDLTRTLDYSFPMPGTVLINEVLAMQPAKVYATGFSCYMDVRDRWLKAEVAVVRDHKPLYDLRFLRDAQRRDDRFEVDSQMLKYFEII